MAGATVLDLLSQHRNDPKLQPLFGALDELAARVQASELQNIGDARVIVTEVPAAQLSPVASFRRSASTKANSLGGPAWGSPGPPTPPLATSKVAIYSVASTRIESAVLPVPPLEPWQTLPPPDGAHDWNALQAAVNAACAQFSSATAKVAWKKWALTQDNVAVVVSVSWWVVAHVFAPDHHLSPSIQEWAFRHFCKRYATDVLTWGGCSRDMYQDLWLGVVATAAVNLLREAFPRSQHKLEASLVHFVSSSLQRWVAGPLPSDLHPSASALKGVYQPAAITRVTAALGAQQAAQRQQQRQRAAAAARRSIVGDTYGFESTVASQLKRGGGMQGTATGAAGDGRGSPILTRVASRRDLTVTVVEGRGDSRATTPHRGVRSVPAVASGAEAGPLLKQVRAAAEAAGLAGDDTAALAVLKGRATSAKSSSSQTPSAHHPDGGNAGSRKGSPDRLARSAPPARPSATTAGATGRTPMVAELAFLTTTTSPAMTHLFEEHQLGMPSHGEVATPGLRHSKIGNTQRPLRRPLDLDAPPDLDPQGSHKAWGRGKKGGNHARGGGAEEAKGPEVSYAAMAKASRARAAEAVCKYEASKMQAKREIAEFKRTGIAPDSQPQPGKTKELSDHLSGWVENDMDRLRKGQPPFTAHVATHTNRPWLEPVKLGLQEPITIDTQSGPGRASSHETVAERGVKKWNTRKPELAPKLQPYVKPSGPTTATEVVLAARGGASTGAVAPGCAAEPVGAGAAPPHFASMTNAALAGAGRASASFLASHAATKGSERSNAPTTRIMQPWSKMRSVESHIRGALSQSRFSSMDVAAHVGAKCAEIDRSKEIGKDGRWRPTPLDYQRGALDFRLSQEVRKAIRAMDMEMYNM